MYVIIFIFLTFSALQRIGIENANAYRNGDWFGNSSMYATRIFKYVTYNFSDLIHKFSYTLDNGEEKSFDVNNFRNLEPRPINDRTFGRCYEIVFKNNNKQLQFVKIVFKKSLFIYMGIPSRFFDYYARSKVQANVNELLYIETNYEIQKNNYGESCRKYSEKYDDSSYDKCIFLYLEENIQRKFNCTMPFFGKSGGETETCRGLVSRMASEYYEKLLRQNAANNPCPDTCNNMISWFGFPFVTKKSENDGTGYAKLYFRQIIKVTEDFISYNLLRFANTNN